MFRAEALWTAALLTTGMVGGVIYNWPSQTSQPPVTDDVTGAKTDPSSRVHERGLSLMADRSSDLSSTDSVQLDPLRLGDRLLLGGNYIGAYQQFAKLHKQTSGTPDNSILLRLGLASELAGFLEQGEQHYRNAIQSSIARSRDQLWALVGTARIWELQGRLDDAIGLLSELYVTCGQDYYPVEIRLSIHRHLADCLLKRYLQAFPAADDLLSTSIEYFWVETRIEPMIANGKDVLPVQATHRDKLEVIQRPIDDVSLILIDAELTSRPLLMLIDDLAGKTNLQIEVSPRARSVLSGRSTGVESNALPVSLLLDQTLGPLALAWDQVGRRLSVWHADDLTAQQKRNYEVDRIQRLLRQLAMKFEHGIERVSALMQDGNTCLLRGNLEDAATKYRSARELQPVGELSAMLYFNRGLLELAQENLEQALKEFYQALDQTLSPPLRGSCYAMIAQLELQLGRPDKAIAAASRGLRLSGSGRHAAQNLLTLAKSYLFESDPFSANRVLFKNATMLTDSRNNRLASVIATYARFQATGPASGLQNEGERLVLSLAALRPDDAEDFVDHVLISRAFHAVGFRSKAIEHLRIAAEDVNDGYWELRVRLELAEMLYLAAEIEKANETLESMLLTPGDALAVKFNLLKAKVKFDLMLTAECESICQSLLKLQLDEEDKKQTLNLLGHVYEKTGKHYSAALCFAGLLPENAVTSIQNPELSH